MFFYRNSSSTVAEHRKAIDGLKDKIDENDLIYQREIQNLIEERDQTKQKLQENENHSNLMKSRLDECQCQLDALIHERISSMEQLSQQSIKHHVEIQTENYNELL